MIFLTRDRRLAMLSTFVAFSVLMAWCDGAWAGVGINEVTLNSENSGGSGSDTGKEFFELKSDVGGESLAGLTFLVIEGDGGAQGTIDQALNLDGFSTGSNGLFLWRDDAAVLIPAPDPATVVTVEDFVPDIENGSGTFVLASGFTGAVSDDLDTDNDGVLDAFPWTAVVDAVSVKDSGDDDGAYAGQLGGIEFPNISFAADSIVRLSRTGDWIAIDINETISEYPGPYIFDDTQALLTDGSAFTPSTALTFNTLTPGSTNPSFVPEPTSWSIAFALIACLLPGKYGRRRIV